MKTKKEKVRVRFAPSPTGSLHVGSVRSALFNYLFAKKNKGKFILRIEDTDQERSEKKYEKEIFEGFNWLKINPDEGVEEGGNFGPYRQSDRINIYQKYIKELIEKNKAYPCFCEEEKLEKERSTQRKKGEAPTYLGTCRNIPEKEREEKIKNDEDYVIRFKTPKGETVSFEDEIQGQVSFETDDIGDFVIARDEKDPLYNMACVIDDYKMKISHVIRGDEHISNTPKQILLYESLGFELPKFAHIPLILAPDKSKLSKRFGAVSIPDYRKKGYLPEAITNYLALLGWSPGDDREFFTLNDLENEFSLERCKKSGAVFDEDKLKYINTLHLKKADSERLAKLIIPYLLEENLITKVDKKSKKSAYKTKDGRKISINQLTHIAKEHRDRVDVLSEITEYTDYFFREIKADFGLLQWKDMNKQQVADSLQQAINIISKIESWNPEKVKGKLLEKANEFDDRGEFLWPLRAALTGEKQSAGPFEVAFILKKKETLNRLKRAANTLK